MSEKRLILVVEDERTISNFICRALTANDYKAMSATTGKEALSLFFSHRPDLVLLDLGLPDMDGLDVLKELSGLPQEVPVIIISARDRESEKVKALDMGADDYVVKPFSPRELMLRISAIMKRGPLLDSMRQQSIEQDGIYIDLIARRVTVDGTQVGLTPKEFDVLALLAANPDVVFSRKKILDTVWGGDLPEDTRTLDTHIKQIRRAITPHNDRIVTLRGVGYRFEKK